MSRCFPYPPPGCALNRASKDALIKSIEFQNEWVKSKELKKERRRKREEKQKEKEDKTKQKQDKSCLVQSQSSEKNWADSKGDSFSNKGKVEPEQQLERSSLTEEHGKPVWLHAPSTSSNSTENSNKRKRLPSPSPPVDGSNGHVKKIIRIRLPLKKHNQSNALPVEQHTCSTSGSTNLPSQNEHVVIGNRNEREQICSTSRPIETFITKKTLNPSMIDPVLTPMQRLELQYTNLMDCLMPPQRQDSLLDGDDDLDWLMKSKNRESCDKRPRVLGDHSMSCSSSSLWPRAQYLQEVDIHALPFTAPF
ncbi:hypothetical protein OROGR_032780 [Orobanche gracilis]